MSTEAREPYEARLVRYRAPAIEQDSGSLVVGQTPVRLGISTYCSQASRGVMLKKRRFFCKVAAMRIVLIEHGGERVLDGLDALDPKSVELSKSAHGREAPDDELAVVAARRFDEREGRYYWDYRFTPFGPRDRRDGYDVFICQHEPGEAGSGHLRDFVVVVTECFYLGYVRCVPPVILIDCRDNRSSSRGADRCLIPANV